ncbi:MAG: winged helix-turn-helix transcriptional regulator [Microbacteriaceae bacterium]|nr:winged helix-turn-helix transcriptional regulator [Microbacteriaceae bacterium]
MTKHSELDEVFRALSDPTRRAIVERLVRSPASVTQLTELFDASMPTIVEHLRVLERAGIVASEKVGRIRTYQLEPDALVPANRWIVAQRRPQEQRLDRLGDYLARPEGARS